MVGCVSKTQDTLNRECDRFWGIKGVVEADFVSGEFQFPRMDKAIAL